MKRFIILIFVMIGLIAQAGVGAIILTPKGPTDNRSGNPLFFDKPEAFHHYDEKIQEIIIDGGGAVSYYNVEISSTATNAVEISTQVNGAFDIIDIASLATGLHVITIYSPTGNSFEGFFSTY